MTTEVKEHDGQAVGSSELLAAGWREYPNKFKKWARCFYKQHDTPTRCACNDDKAGIQIEIAVSDTGDMEMEVSGQLKDGTWMHLHNYSLPPTTAGVLALIPRMLATWESANISNNTKSDESQ
jgi:hypothetical protein